MRLRQLFSRYCCLEKGLLVVYKRAVDLLILARAVQEKSADRPNRAVEPDWKLLPEQPVPPARERTRPLPVAALVLPFPCQV